MSKNDLKLRKTKEFKRRKVRGSKRKVRGRETRGNK